MSKKFARIYIELTNRCNYSCPFCAELNREKTDIPFSLFKKIAKEAKEYTNEICLHVLGEPLIYENLEKVIKLCKKLKLKINLVTNGYFLKDKLNILQKFKDTFTKISVSLHSLQFANIDKEKKLNEILQTAKILSGQSINIELRLLSRNSENDAFVSFAQAIIIKTFKTELNENLSSNKLADKLFLVYKNKFTWPDKNIDNACPSSVRNGRKVYCLGTKTHIAILCDGTVVPCCLDANGQLNLGNINKDTLKEILQSENFLKLNKEFSENKASNKLCQNCEYNKKF